jgi:D-aspartate ligase
VPVVVVQGTLNGLGVVRSLSHGRMPIYLLETTARCAARWSRHCRYVPVAAVEGPKLVDALVDLGRQFACRPVLMLTGDQSVNSVSAQRERLESLYRINLPEHEIVRTLADKTLFHSLAEREGFPVPRSVSISNTTGLAALDDLTPPLIVKPADKTLVLNGTVERALRAATHAEARHAAAHMLASAPAVIVQEWVEGPDTELYFTLFTCDRDGRPVGVFVGRKLLSSPPATGSTAVCVPAPEVAKELVPPTLEFIARLRYRGLGSLEFKRDNRTGRFVIIEPTVGRTDLQEELATLCGVNLPLMAYLAEIGERVDAVCIARRPAVAWRQSAGFRAQLAPGMRTVDGLFRWSDPLPGLWHYGFEQVVMRIWKKLVPRAERRAPARSASKKA